VYSFPYQQFYTAIENDACAGLHGGVARRTVGGCGRWRVRKAEPGSRTPALPHQSTMIIPTLKRIAAISTLIVTADSD
jgi:hypothetical protein